jgi:hypothetical protein
MPLAGANVLTVTIANGASLSGAAEIGAGTLVGIQLPTFTSAALTFQGSADGVTYVEVVDATNTAVTFTATTGALYIKAPADLVGVPYIKVRSGTVGAAVNQGGARTISLVVK